MKIKNLVCRTTDMFGFNVFSTQNGCLQKTSVHAALRLMVGFTHPSNGWFSFSINAAELECNMVTFRITFDPP